MEFESSRCLDTGQELRPAAEDQALFSLPSAGKPDLRARVETSFERVEDLRDDWDGVAAHYGGSIYSSFDWNKTWWEFYGKGRQLRIFLFYANEQIVGILPMYIDRVGYKPLQLTVARLVGANIPPKPFCPPLDPAWATEIASFVRAHLLDCDKCDVLSYGPVSELHESLPAWESVLGERGTSIGQPVISTSVHSVFWLPGSLEEYLESLGKTERKNRRYYELRLLKKEYDTRVEVLTGSKEVEEEFERFVVQHTCQWKAQGKPGHFGAWPKAVEYNRALVKVQGRLGRVRFVRIVANNQVIASLYAFAFGDSWFAELPARAVGEDWERFSLGATGVVTLIDTAIKEGKHRVEGGLAHYEYKRRLKAKEYLVKTLRLVADRPGSRTRATLFGWFRLVLQAGYHKIWYQRIAPRLPACWPKKAQWNIWLRMDY